MEGERYPIISPIGGVVAGIFFFMPWVGFAFVKKSGADTGGILWLAFLAAIGIVGLFFHYNAQKALFQAKVPIVVCAAIGIGSMLLRGVAFASSRWSEVFDLEYGSIVTLVGFLVALYGTTHFPKNGR